MLSSLDGAAATVPYSTGIATPRGFRQVVAALALGKRPVTSFRLLFLAVAVLAIGSVAPSTAAPPPARWQAVLIAGDKSEPVFDNGTAALYSRLAAIGVPAANIHRLSANGGYRDPAVEPATANRLLQRIASLQPRPGERCLVFITSHGRRGRGVWLAAAGEYLQPGALAQALSAGCGRVPTVVVVSACYSGMFAGGPMSAPNRIVMTAARADRPSFGCQADRTYTVYDECLLDAVPRSASWRRVAEDTNACVSRHEQELGVLPSQPQASFGAAVQDLSVR